MIYLVLWCIFGLIASSISERRGNGRMAGFLWGLLLGPIGIIIVLLLTPKYSAYTQGQTIQAGHYKLCPQCAESIRADARVCRYCGYEVPASLVLPDPVLVDQMRRDLKPSDNTKYRRWYAGQLQKKGVPFAIIDASMEQAVGERVP